MDSLNVFLLTLKDMVLLFPCSQPTFFPVFFLCVYMAYLSSPILHLAACLCLLLLSFHSGWAHYWADVRFFWRVGFLPVGCIGSHKSGPWGVLIGAGQPNQFLWPEWSSKALQEEALLGKGSESREEVLWDLWTYEACFTCPSRWENLNSIKLQKIIVLTILQFNHEEKNTQLLKPIMLQSKTCFLCLGLAFGLSDLDYWAMEFSDSWYLKLKRTNELRSNFQLCLVGSLHNFLESQLVAWQPCINKNTHKK